jgi:glycosyltransferase involved in cell wall biosynthesis
MKSGIEISVVSPVFCGEDCVPELVRRTLTVLSELSDRFELILVDDGSPDASWTVIQEAHKRDPHHVRGLRLSRNFGQHNAIAAGLLASRGEWVVVMDCDLQDQPEEIAKLYHHAKSGFDVVHGRRKDRQDSAMKRGLSHLFFRVLGYLTDLKLDPAVGNFSICHRRVVDAVNSLQDRIRWYPGLVRWVGFKSAAVDITHRRASGRSTYSLRRLVNFAVDIFLMSSDKPLRLTVKAGVLISALSVLGGVYVVIRAMRGEVGVLGWSSLIVSIWFLSGLVIFVLGIIGLYIGKIFNEVRGRPAFIIGEVLAVDRATNS